MNTAMKKPRYQELADDLRGAILRGDFPAHDQFPTESELCGSYGVSRFTVREALRALQDEGLIRRKRGSGTVIQPAAARGGALHQPISNVGELLQYARDTRVDFVRLKDTVIPKRLMEQLPSAMPGKWSHFRGLRISETLGAPIALTDAYIHPDLSEAVADLDPAEDTIFRQLVRLGHLRIAQVTQDIQAVPASAALAGELQIARGSACLRILRCYYDTTGRLFEISTSLHSGNRFAYAMHMDVER